MIRNITRGITRDITGDILGGSVSSTPLTATIYPNSTIDIAFSEEIDPLTVTTAGDGTGSFEVYNLSTPGYVAGVISTSDNITFTFTPTLPLTISDNYIIYLSTTIQGTSGRFYNGQDKTFTVQNTLPVAPVISLIALGDGTATAQVDTAGTDAEDGTVNLYNIYVDDVLNTTQTILQGNNYQLTGLTNDSLQVITFKTKDSNGGLSADSNSLNAVPSTFAAATSLRIEANLESYSDNDPVTAMSDYSLNGLAVSVSGSPTYLAAEVSGQSAIQFDGDSLSIGAVASLKLLHNGSDHKIYIGFRADSGNSATGYILDNCDKSSANIGTAVAWVPSDGHVFGFITRGVLGQSAIPLTATAASSIPVNTFLSLEISLDQGIVGNDYLIDKNGSNLTGNEPAFAFSAADASYPLKVCTDVSGVNPLKATIAYIIVINDLTYDSAVRTYLAANYGV